MNSEFAIDVDKGFSDKKKYLSSKYFYDDEGSLLFQQIMELPEYYLTRAELNIFQTRSLDILDKIRADNLDILLTKSGFSICFSSVGWNPSCRHYLLAAVPRGDLESSR